ncbi:MAG TPA: alpha/beta hydrolase, partial [Anaerolineae bacterium]|nr:alpha/beta hydrolase [Anaerolineae bacterium]
FYIAAHIKDGDPASWVCEFRSYGDRLQQTAGELEQQHQLYSASETYLKAFACYRAAAQFTSPRQAEFKELVQLFKTNFQHGLRLACLPLETIRIPFEGKTLPGYFLRAATPTAQTPTLIVIGGGDTYCEDLYFFAGLAGHRRGYHTVMVDLPGQGDTPFQGLHFMAETERPVASIVDYLLSHTEIARERLAIIGFSGGGYMVTRAVSHEKRIAACIADTPLFDVRKLLESEIPRGLGESRTLVRWLLRLSNSLNQAGAVNAEKYAWQAGVQSLDEFIYESQQGQADISQITCPYLALVGTGDPAEALRQTEIAYQTIPAAIKGYRLFTEADGGEAHCQVSNLTLLHQVVFDWLDEIFTGLAHNQAAGQNATSRDTGAPSRSRSRAAVSHTTRV